MENNNGGKYSGFFSKKLRAGKRRTYFFDVRSTKQGDFFLTITESKKKFEGEGYDSHKVFLYKEDFKKFMEALNETMDYIKTDLMPEYDYDSERPARNTDGGDDEGHHYSNDSYKSDSTEADTTERPVRNDAPVNNVTTNITTTPQISYDEEMDWK